MSFFDCFSDMSAHSGQMNKVDEQQIRTFYGSLKNFDIIHYLGKGQFSVVYSARNRFTNQLVALKRIEVRFLVCLLVG